MNAINILGLSILYNDSIVPKNGIGTEPKYSKSKSN